MTITLEQLQHLAKLSHIALTPTEQVSIQNDFGAILTLIDQLTATQTAGVPPLHNPLEMHQILRPDVVSESNEREQILAIAPLTHEGAFLVPQVIEHS